MRATLGKLERFEHALGNELFGCKSTKSSDLVGILETLQASDGRTSHVDVVRGAKRLTKNVVDAGLFENGASSTTRPCPSVRRGLTRGSLAHTYARRPGDASSNAHSSSGSRRSPGSSAVTTN